MSNNSEQSLEGLKQEAAKRRAGMVAERLLISLDECSALRKQTPEQLKKQVLAGKVLELDIDGSPYYPTFYGDRSLNQDDLTRVIVQLADLEPWIKYGFLTTPKLSLEGITPLEALKSNQLERVLVAAAGARER